MWPRRGSWPELQQRVVVLGVALLPDEPLAAPRPLLQPTKDPFWTPFWRGGHQAATGGEAARLALLSSFN